MIRTEAWVLYEGKEGSESAANRLRYETFDIEDLVEGEVLVEPICGCWEGNMSHALRRQPIDICRARKESRVVLGNAGTVRVVGVTSGVKELKEGDLCLTFCNGQWDEKGYPKKIFAYDAPGSVGLLAKRTKMHQRQLIKIPANTRYSLHQWAAFSLRYITAWANWKVSYGCWSQMESDEDHAVPSVWGWGGGVTLAELALAKNSGCNVVMMASAPERLQIIRETGITAVDRRQFGDLNFQPELYESDPAYRQRYLDAEQRFLECVNQQTQGRKVSIFIDFIGGPVFRATLKALGRPGIVTTAGWKAGMSLSTVRALECMSWHVHVHTHYARYRDGQAAVSFAESNGWLPTLSVEPYEWSDINRLAEDYEAGRLATYFPLFNINRP